MICQFNAFIKKNQLIFKHYYKRYLTVLKDIENKDYKWIYFFHQMVTESPIHMTMSPEFNVAATSNVV